MRKLALAAVAAAALAAPLSPATAAQCSRLVGGPGANEVGTCQERVWEKQRIWYYCSVDTDLDGTADAVCEPLFVIEYYG